eukprot:TRINITY_DN13605_c0_g2_i1.p1 TRINITY_DN13605_c0_g2~~TRINITY_DN13605_c0_g2_i1.p1  ORF type:complete len:994 (-),score=220.12 TRINITY_DN13605_c0_g2_i1:40-3021(-)
MERMVSEFNTGDEHITVTPISSTNAPPPRGSRPSLRGSIRNVPSDITDEGEPLAALERSISEKRLHSRVKASTRQLAWIETLQAEFVFITLVVINALTAGIRVEIDLRSGDEESVASTVLFVIDLVLSVFFMVELYLRIRALGVHWVVRTVAGAFDTVIVFVTFVSLWIVDLLGRSFMGSENVKALTYLRMLRLLRIAPLVRIVRLLRLSKELFLLIKSLVASLRAVVWVFLLLFVVMYIGALFCANTLGRSENPLLQQAFGSFWVSFYSHFKMMTLEGWPDMNGEAMKESAWWPCYFIGYITLTNLALVNLVLGLIMEGVTSMSKHPGWQAEMHACEAAVFFDTICEIVHEKHESDLKGDDTRTIAIDFNKFRELCQDRAVQYIFNLYGISLRIDLECLFRLVDTEGRGEVTPEELAEGLLHFRGSREAIHPVQLRDDLRRNMKMVSEEIEESSRRFLASYEGSVRAFEDKLGARFAEVERDASKAAADTAAELERRLEASRQAALIDAENADVASVSSEDPVPRPAFEEAFAKKRNEAVQKRKAEQQRKAAQAAQVLRERAEKQRLAAEARERQDALDAKLAQLLREAGARARRLDETTLAVEEELGRSLALEAALEEQLAARANARSSETDAALLGQSEDDATRALNRFALDAAIDAVVNEAARSGAKTSSRGRSLSRLELKNDDIAADGHSIPRRSDDGASSSESSCAKGSFCPAPRLVAAVAAAREKRSASRSVMTRPCLALQTEVAGDTSTELQDGTVCGIGDNGATDANCTVANRDSTHGDVCDGAISSAGSGAQTCVLRGAEEDDSDANTLSRNDGAAAHVELERCSSRGSNAVHGSIVGNGLHSSDEQVYWTQEQAAVNGSGGRQHCPRTLPKAPIAKFGCGDGGEFAGLTPLTVALEAETNGLAASMETDIVGAGLRSRTHSPSPRSGGFKLLHRLRNMAAAQEEARPLRTLNLGHAGDYIPNGTAGSHAANGTNDAMRKIEK